MQLGRYLTPKFCLVLKKYGSRHNGFCLEWIYWYILILCQNYRNQSRNFLLQFFKACFFRKRIRLYVYDYEMKVINQNCCYAKACNEFVGAHFRVIVPRQHSYNRKNVTAMASRWQHCVRFDRPEIWTADLPIQRLTRCCSTNWHVFLKAIS